MTRTFTSGTPPGNLPPCPRVARRAPGGIAYHVLNRANGKLRLFRKDEDYLAFEAVLLAAHGRVPGARVLGWCLMPNHFHLVLWPRRDGELTAFTRWLTLTHAQRWKHAHGAVGHGHLYQGRRPRDWLAWVNAAQTPAEEAAMKAHIARGRPLGDAAWTRHAAAALALQQTLRPRGRPEGWRKRPRGDKPK